MSDSTDDSSANSADQQPPVGVDDLNADAAEVESGATPDGPEPETLPLDVVYGILKNRRRRLVLRYLADGSERSTLSDLAEHVAAIENDKSTEALSSAERKRVYVSLYQGHLPRLHEAGLVDFDDDRGTVSVHTNVDQVLPYLQQADEEAATSARVALAVGVGGVGLLVAQLILVPSNPLTLLLVGALLGFGVNVALERHRASDQQTPRRAADPSERVDGTS